jgi:raffinose/stachyose/melibiose transport system permease protein
MGSPAVLDAGAPSGAPVPAVPLAPERRRERRRSSRRGGRAVGGPRPPRGTGLPIALSLVPALVVVAVFFLVPLGVLVVTSFADWGGAGFRWIGLDNFSRLFGDDVFWKAARNTLVYCLVGLLVQVPLGVLAGIMLAQRLPGWRIYRTILFIPYMISGAAYALIFALFYNAEFGLLNNVVGLFGFEGRDWLYSSSTALLATAGTFAFILGFNALLTMAEVGSIPRELYEAAELDGASAFQRQRLITLPLLRNVIGTLVLITLLASIAMFDVVFILTAGGPDNATVTLTLYAYRAYATGAWGFANAVGVVIVVTGLVLIVGARRAFRIGERTL